MSNSSTYRHTQQAPLCLLVYGIGIVLLGLAWAFRNEPVALWLFLPVAAVVFVLGGSFHHLTVEDVGEALSIRFGPIPVFQRTVKYSEILSAETGRTTFLDGWGIHLSLKGGWVWNLWGRDCVVLQLRKSCLRVGTDDPNGLTHFLRQKIGPKDSLEDPTRIHSE